MESPGSAAKERAQLEVVCEAVSDFIYLKGLYGCPLFNIVANNSNTEIIRQESHTIKIIKATQHPHAGRQL